ncbi:hypothetical protein BJP36_42640 [Moorena producens JHB]|uniref:Uncharacterized protein n=1 Tax=Moorena producens (strain JHB) TaxID=1454205 RepID=A0A9Q9SSX7_MOOP1|nr:hypothetical protein [Moorena producens]NEQ14958.1 hypothetical protein [Moorena sp. SIO3E2]WAN69056.1 hypothetical protein BJP36_42640 [Moorena producens JHB]
MGEPPRPHCLPKTALPPQDRTCSPMAALHRFCPTTASVGDMVPNFLIRIIP